MPGYYRRWLSVAFTHSWGKTESAATLAGIVVPAVAKMSGGDGAMSDLVWQIPLGIFLFLFVVRFVLAPWWMHKEQELAFAGQTAQREKTFEDAIREMKEELLSQIKAITTERDSTAASLATMKAERDRKRASVDDILDRVLEFARAGRKLDNGTSDQAACDQWYERSHRFVTAAFRPRLAEEFAQRWGKHGSQAFRFRVSECVSWLNGWSGKLKEEHTNPAFTEVMLAAHPVN